MNKSQTIFVTGATGFVGRHLVAALSSNGFKVVVGVRDTSVIDTQVESKRFVLNEHTDVDLTGIDCVIHLAGLAHTVNASAEKLNEINHVGTQRISHLAAKQGVKKFIFLSSIGVNGCTNDISFNESSEARPFNDYTVSKYYAEQALVDATEQSQMQSFIIRAPLIYGKDAPGNFRALIKYADSSIPLPFAGIKNERSLCSISNLCDFIMCCCTENSEELDQIERFVIADDKPVSTSELFTAISSALGKGPRLVDVPKTLLRFLFKATNKQQLEASLMRDLTVDNSYAKQKLNWSPRLTLAQELSGLDLEQRR